MIPRGWEGVRRVLAVRLDNLGDVIMTGPALRTLAQSLPDVRITLLASPGGAVAAQLLPWVDDTMVQRSLWQDLGSLPFDPSRELELVERLSREHFDAAMIFTSFSQTPHAAGYACYLAGIPIRVGASKEFGGGVLSSEYRLGDDQDHLHQVDRNLLLLERQGFRIGDRHLEVRVPESAQQSLSDKLRRVGVEEGHSRFIVAAPWASCPARTYTPSDMAAAAVRIGVRTGLPVILSGHERNRDESRELALRGDGALINLVGELDFLEFAALVQRASLLLCNNSAPMHLADATSTPCLVLYAGTELESQWRPRKTEARLLRRRTACQPCYAFDCRFEDHPCLAIPVDEVVEAGLQLLREEPVGAAS